MHCAKYYVNSQWNIFVLFLALQSWWVMTPNCNANLLAVTELSSLFVIMPCFS